MAPQRSFPMQPLERDNRGVIRFKENRIIVDLFNSGKLDLNLIAVTASRGSYSAAEQMQIAQLLGYSVEGFADLSYADRDVVRRARNSAKRI